VRVKKPFSDTIGIIIVVNMLMMVAMFAGPEENGILERAGSEHHGGEPNNPVSLES
jgi:hypothetical protein